MGAKKVIIGVVCLSTLGLTACGYSSDSASTTIQEDISANDTTIQDSIQTVKGTIADVEQVEEDETTQAEKTEATENQEESCIKIVSHSIGKDYNNNDVLIIEYEWTNTEDKETSFMAQFNDKVFQNGIECSSTVIGCDEIDSQKQMNDIQPGTVYNLKIGYLLQDNTTANVVVNSLFGDTTYLNENIDLGGGDGNSTQQEEKVNKEETSFSIVSTSISKDYEDNDVLVVEYAFYNGEDKATSFTFACNDKVFQNGVECDSNVIGCDDIDTQQQLNDVQPGNTYNIKVGYHLQDDSQANIVVTDLFGNIEYLNTNIDIAH